jgi:hypothetical protein
VTRRPGVGPTGDARLDTTLQELSRSVFDTGVSKALVLTTTQRDAEVNWRAGDFIFNSTTGKHQGYDGATWSDFY